MRVSRREFLAGVTAAGAVALVGRFAPAQQTAKVVRGTDRITLGQTGIRSTVLGIGTGTRGGSEQIGLGQDAFTRLVHEAFDRGIRYIDTADSYRTHLFVGFALKGLPRDEIFIQTKLRAAHPEVAKADIERFRREMGVETLDTVLMHCMTKGTWPVDMRPVMDVLSDAKAKGRVRAVGISCHGWDPLVASVDVDWIDVQLVRINPQGTLMDGKPDDVAAQIAKMHAKGRGVIGMKIYGEGAFTTREARLASLKYVLGLGTVDCFTIGFKSVEQIDETLQLILEAQQG